MTSKPGTHGWDHLLGGEDPIPGLTSGYTTIQDEGVARAQRAILDFAGAGVTATDDAANSRTLVTIPGGSPWDAIITKAADQSITSQTSPQNDTEMFFTPALTGVYRFEVALGVHDPAGIGIKWDMGIDTTVRGAVARVAISVATSVIAVANVAFNVVNVSTGPTGFTDWAVVLWGFFTGLPFGSGDFHFRWAQNSSNVNPVTVKAGSTLSYRRIF